MKSSEEFKKAVRKKFSKPIDFSNIPTTNCEEKPVLRKGLNADIVYEDPSHPVLIKHVFFEDAWIVEGEGLIFELLHFSPSGFVFKCKKRSE